MYDKDLDITDTFFTFVDIVDFSETACIVKQSHSYHQLCEVLSYLNCQSLESISIRLNKCNQEWTNCLFKATDGLLSATDGYYSFTSIENMFYISKIILAYANDSDAIDKLIKISKCESKLRRWVAELSLCDQLDNMGV